MFTERLRLGFGVDLVVDRLASGLAELGHEVTVYPAYSDGTYEGSGYTTTALRTRASNALVLADLAAIRAVRRVDLSAHDLAIVHTPPFFAALSAQRLPFLAIDYGVSSTTGFPLRVKVNAAYRSFFEDRFWFTRAKGVIPISRFLFNQLPPRIQKKASTINLGFDHHPRASRTDGEELRRQLGIPVEAVVALYLGRLAIEGAPYKGTAELAETFSDWATRAPGRMAVMAGFGTSQDVAALESKGILARANLEQALVPALLAASDIVVSASRWEGFGLLMAEAQNAARPALCLAVGAHPEVVDDNVTGLLAQSDADLASKLELLACDPGLRARLGTAGALKAESNTWAQCSRQVHEVVMASLHARNRSD